MNDDQYFTGRDLNGFLLGVDRALDEYLQVYGATDGSRDTGLCDNETLYLADIGGTGLLHHLDIGRRRANDLDFAVIHTHIPNDEHSYREAKAVEDAFGIYGFRPTRGNGAYRPTSDAINILENTAYDKETGGLRDGDIRNNLPIPKIDVFGGDRPLGTYPIEWVFDNMEAIEVEEAEGRKRPLTHVTTLSLPAITARKVYRSTVDNMGEEDRRQSHDLGTIYDHVKRFDPGKQSWFRSEFKDAWSRLVLANRRSDALQAYEDELDRMLDDQWGWQYFQDETNRA